MTISLIRISSAGKPYLFAKGGLHAFFFLFCFCDCFYVEATSVTNAELFRLLLNMFQVSKGLFFQEEGLHYWPKRKMGKITRVSCHGKYTTDRDRLKILLSSLCSA